MLGVGCGAAACVLLVAACGRQPLLDEPGAPVWGAPTSLDFGTVEPGEPGGPPFRFRFDP